MTYTEQDIADAIASADNLSMLLEIGWRNQGRWTERLDALAEAKAREIGEGMSNEHLRRLPRP